MKRGTWSRRLAGVRRLLTDAAVHAYHGEYEEGEQSGFAAISEIAVLAWAARVQRRATREAVRRRTAGAPTKGLRGTEFSQNVRRYMDAIEQHTGFRLHPSQRARLADNLRTTNYRRLTPEAARAHLRGFTQRVRETRIAEWERQTRQSWPRYTEELLNAERKVLRRAGDAYDAHHVIENVSGGPHKWWNLTPARFPGQHQGGIHLEAIVEILFPWGDDERPSKTC